MLATTLFMWWQPILADEWDFILAAEDWYANRQLIPHPQGYVHLLQIAFLTTTDHLDVVRIPGVLSGLVTLTLIPLTVRHFVNATNRETNGIAILAVWLFALSPLTIQNMMLVDIDNTILVPSLLAVLLLWKVTVGWSWPRRTLTLAIAFTLLLWLKLPTPILLLGTLFLFHLLRYELRSLVIVIGAAAACLLLWYLSFIVYNSVTGFSFAYFNRTVSRAAISMSTIRSMVQLFPQTQGLLVLWLSIPLSVLLGFALVRSCVRFLSFRSSAYDILSLWSIVGLCFYGVIIAPAWGYPKYHAPFIPVFAILTAATVFPYARKLSGQRLFVLGALGLLYLVYARFYAGDPLWALYSVTFRTDTHDLSERIWQGMLTFTEVGLPVAAGLGIAGIFAHRWKTSLLGTCMATLLVLSLAMMTHIVTVQVSAPYSTRYRYTYNYHDFQQAVAELHSMDGYVLAPKDLLLYSGQMGKDIFPILEATCPQGCLYESIVANDVRALVWTTKEQNRATELKTNSELTGLLATCFKRTQYGVFIIHTRHPACSRL